MAPFKSDRQFAAQNKFPSSTVSPLFSAIASAACAKTPMEKNMTATLIADRAAIFNRIAFPYNRSSAETPMQLPGRIRASQFC
jgi:hypothetical protein